MAVASTNNGSKMKTNKDCVSITTSCSRTAHDKPFVPSSSVLKPTGQWAVLALSDPVLAIRCRRCSPAVIATWGLFKSHHGGRASPRLCGSRACRAYPGVLARAPHRQSPRRATSSTPPPRNMHVLAVESFLIAAPVAGLVGERPQCVKSSGEQAMCHSATLS